MVSEYRFCTYFDSRYLLRGLTLYRSLRASGCAFRLTILALDDEAELVLRKLNLPGVDLLTLAELESWLPELQVAKGDRSRVEYYFTLSPVVPLYVLTKDPAAVSVTYLDADLYFYGSPAPIFAELGEGSILICEHRYSSYLHDNARYGHFNVQYQTFRRDDTGLACLRRWQTQCLEWCHDRVEDGRYADQKYLDEWPALYGERLVVLKHPGAGVAPWNWANSHLQLKNGTVTAAGQPLIFYHFHGVKLFGNHLLSNGLADWGMMPWRLQRWFYAGYLRELRRTRSWVVAETGREWPMRDRFLRGGGIGLQSLGEITRKAWSQAMIVP